MSTISASTTSTTGYVVTSDTTGTLVMKTGATPTTAVTIDGSQNIGVGTTSPAARLDVAGGATSYGFKLRSGGNAGIYIASFADTNGAGEVRIDNNGNLIVGAAGSGGNQVRWPYTSASASSRSWAIRNDWSAYGDLAFVQSTTQTGTSFDAKMTLDSSGNLLVGATSSLGGSPKVSIYQASAGGFSTAFKSTKDGTNTSYFVNWINDAGSQVGYVYTNQTTTTYATSSDYRLKNITGTLTGYKERLFALQPKQGSWKADGSEFRGFLAHEFAESYPTSVSGEKDAVDADGNPRYQGMQAGTSEVIADLVSLIKEQQSIIQQLQSDVSALKGQA